VFYQLRWLLVFLVIPRVVFVGQMLVDPDRLPGGITGFVYHGITTTEVRWKWDSAAGRADDGGWLLPLVILGLNASIGLLLSTVFKARGPQLSPRR
jgi:hypothetical protein